MGSRVFISPVLRNRVDNLLKYVVGVPVLISTMVQPLITEHLHEARNSGRIIYQVALRSHLFVCLAQMCVSSLFVLHINRFNLPIYRVLSLNTPLQQLHQ